MSEVRCFRCRAILSEDEQEYCSVCVALFQSISTEVVFDDELLEEYI